MNTLFRILRPVSAVAALLFVLFCMVVPVHALEGVCISVSDGDTIIVRCGKATEKVRLRGIDAPEREQTGGVEATEYLKARILRKKVSIKEEGRDTYDRLLGVVYLGRENINLSMVRAGWAWDYALSNAGKEYTSAQLLARAAKRGIWAEDAPQAPWKFRRASASAKAPREEPSAAERTEDFNLNSLRPGAANARYWISNSGKTHNRDCEMFLGNSGTGSYSDTPGAVDAKCCGGAGR